MGRENRKKKMILIKPFKCHKLVYNNKAISIKTIGIKKIIIQTSGNLIKFISKIILSSFDSHGDDGCAFLNFESLHLPKIS